MKLEEIVSQFSSPLISGDTSVEIQGVSADSRTVEKDFLYIAIKSDLGDGAEYISQAIDAGAVAVVSESHPQKPYRNVQWIQVKDAREALATAACLFNGHPSKEMKLIGVTGTNGKTTTTYMIHHILQQIQVRAGLIGTVKVHDGVSETNATYTTPDAVSLNKTLRMIADNGCRSVAMEVSSHGIVQKRIQGVEFDVVAFSNLTQDHLDYHGSMEAYFAAKRQLFTDSANSGRKIKAVINLDDPYGERLIKEFATKMNVVTYGVGVHSDYRIGKIKQMVKGTEFELQAKGKSYLVRVPTIGRFNVYNAVCAITCCVSAGFSPRQVVRSIADMSQVPGRMELVESKMGMSVFVDYAHTPDALANVCKTLRELQPKRLITVFGCGGDRDTSKRPLMARAAAEYSDLCLITSDNPRGEDPEKILKDIEAGMAGAQFRSIVDRYEAIKTAIAFASGGDVVLIAGKGHEDYQIFKDETIPFDDRIKARAALREFKIPNIQKEREGRPID
jgi:UDP-N-acetylmuramoyl-L-alanyl-D-glutamate--2,6-diaminopimelate ligase